jgi:sugar phosphate isomerase/epimerase
VHERLCVSGISTWGWTLDEDLAFYAEAGIHTIGASLRKLEAEGVDAGVRALLDAGIEVANVIGLGPFRLDQPAKWPEQQDRLLLAIDVAQRLDAGCLVLTTGPSGSMSWEDAADALEAALQPALPMAASTDVMIALEHTNSLRVDVGFVHTLRDALDLADRLGVRVCMEVNACWAERDLAGTIARRIDGIALVQVSDFVIGTTTTPDRAVPGDGDIPLRRILGHLLAAGYHGMFDLEIIGPRIEAEGYASAVRRSVGWLGGVLEELDT